MHRGIIGTKSGAGARRRQNPYLRIYEMKELWTGYLVMAATACRGLFMENSADPMLRFRSDLEALDNNITKGAPINKLLIFTTVRNTEHKCTTHPHPVSSLSLFVLSAIIICVCTRKWGHCFSSEPDYKT
jgi:hypothetical protein